MTEETTPKENTKPGYLKKIFEYILEHPAVAGTVIYFGVSVIGVIYTWALYREFQINIFDFAETNDFLLAAFKEPFAFAMGIVSVLGGVVCMLVYKYIELATDAYKRFIYRLFRLKPGKLNMPSKSSNPIKSAIRISCTTILLLVYLFIPAYFYAKKNADDIINNEKSIVNVLYKERRDEALTPVAQRLKASLIGSTDKFLFFYVHSDKQSIVIPIANITSIKFEPFLPSLSEQAFFNTVLEMMGVKDKKKGERRK
jgi:hypothetical protein